MEKLRDINPAHERFGYLSLVVAGALVLAIGLLVRSDLFLSVVGIRSGDHRLAGHPGRGCHSRRGSRGLRQRARLVGQDHRGQQPLRR